MYISQSPQLWALSAFVHRAALPSMAESAITLHRQPLHSQLPGMCSPSAPALSQLLGTAEHLRVPAGPFLSASLLSLRQSQLLPSVVHQCLLIV